MYVLCMYVCIYVCMNVCVCVCMYVYVCTINICTDKLLRYSYPPDKTLNFDAQVIKCTQCHCLLLQETQYHATTKTRTITQVLARLERGEIEPGDTDVWPGSTLPIPPCPPSGLPGCTIIEINYFVKVRF